MTLPESSPPRRRGAPSGNINAVKHGFYSSRFKKSERDALDTSQFSGLSEEIAMLRLFIRRLVVLSASVEDLPTLLECLRVVSLASSSLARLVRLQGILSSSSARDAIHNALDAALEDFWKEANNSTSSSQSPSPLEEGRGEVGDGR